MRDASSALCKEPPERFPPLPEAESMVVGEKEADEAATTETLQAAPWILIALTVFGFMLASAGMNILATLFYLSHRHNKKGAARVKIRARVRREWSTPEKSRRP